MMMTNQIWRPTLHCRDRSAASAACLPPWEHLLKIRGKWRHWLECAKWKGVTRRQGAKLPMNACLVSWSGHKLMTALVENYDSCTVSYLESKFYPVCTFSYREEVLLLGQKLNQNRFMGKSKPKYLSYHHRWSLPAASCIQSLARNLLPPSLLLYLMERPGRRLITLPRRPLTYSILPLCHSRQNWSCARKQGAIPTTKGMLRVTKDSRFCCDGLVLKLLILVQHSNYYKRIALINAHIHDHLSALC